MGNRAQICSTRVSDHWNELAWEVVQVPFLNVIGSRLNAFPEVLLCCKWSYLAQCRVEVGWSLLAWNPLSLLCYRFKLWDIEAWKAVWLCKMDVSLLAAWSWRGWEFGAHFQECHSLPMERNWRRRRGVGKWSNEATGKWGEQARVKGIAPSDLGSRWEEDDCRRRTGKARSSSGSTTRIVPLASVKLHCFVPVHLLWNPIAPTSGCIFPLCDIRVFLLVFNGFYCLALQCTKMQNKQNEWGKYNSKAIKPI